VLVHLHVVGCDVGSVRWRSDNFGADTLKNYAAHGFARAFDA
jgi:hypothetical protein